jgi:hypothetical protein
MWKSLIALSLTLFGFGLAVHAWARWNRRRAVRSVDPATIVRMARDVHIRAAIDRIPAFSGLDPERVNRTRGDLVLARDRFLVATDRGILADVGPDRGRPFTSARCTGPTRLVIEGEVARGDGTSGTYRFEFVVDDAEGWAEALVPFVLASSDGPRFAVRPPA